MNDPALLQEALVELARVRESAEAQKNLLDALCDAGREAIHAPSDMARWRVVIENLGRLLEFDFAAIFPPSPLNGDKPLYASDALLESLEYGSLVPLPREAGGHATLAIDLTAQSSAGEKQRWAGPAAIRSLILVDGSREDHGAQPCLFLGSKSIGAFNRKTIELIQQFLGLLALTSSAPETGGGSQTHAHELPIAWVRLSDKFRVLAANEIGCEFLSYWELNLGETLPEELTARLFGESSPAPHKVDLRVGGHFFSCDLTQDTPSTWTLIATDITAQRKKSRGLENSNRRLRYVLNALSVAVLVEATDGAPLLSNPAYQELFDSPLLSNALRSESNQALSDLEASLVTAPIEFVKMRTRRTPSGTPDQKVFEANDGGNLLLGVSPVFNENKEVYRVWQFTPIPTTLHKSFPADSLRTVQQLIELRREPALIANSDGVIIAANSMAMEFLKQSPAALNDALLTSLLPPAYHEALSTSQRRALNGDMSSFQAPFLRPHSPPAHAEINIAAIDLQQRRALVVSFRERSTTQLLDSQLKTLSSVVDNFGVGVAIADIRGRVEWINKVFQTSTGYSQAQTIGTPLGELLSCPDADPKQLAAIETHIRDRKPMQAEILCQRASGALFWNSINISVVRNESGEASRFLAVVSDISDRKMNEEEMLRAQRDAVQASKSKSEFLAVMSHEIRTPLNAILGLTELALQGNLPSEHRSLLRSVQANSEVLTSILRDVLDFSKIEARQTTTVEKPFSLLEVTESVADALSVHAEAKGLDLVCYCDPRIPRTLIGDADHLRQVLINLVGNAIKFTDQGEILLETTLEKSTSEESTIQIVVEDTGVGIPKAQIENVFEQFVQADQSTHRQFGGTGLGLSITRSLVELMGGKIRVDSAVGDGSRFTIDLSLPAPTGTPAPSKSISVFNGITAMLCDRNLRSRHAVDRLLSHWGVDVTTSDSIEAVGEAIRGVTDVDVLLVDFSTYQAHQMRHARRRSTPAATSAPQCQILVLCRSSDLEPRLLDDPAAKYITKPVRQENLRLSLAQALRIEQLTHAAEADARQQQVQMRSSHKVLLIEDNIDNRKLTIAMLERNGMTIEAFENGADAIEAFTNSEYDIILTDLEMPGMDGVQVAQRIRALEKRLHTKKTPIVAVTAHALVTFQERCLAAGMDAFITKPVRWPELFEKLDELLASKPKILIVDDSPDARAIARKLLSTNDDYDLEVVESGEAALKSVAARRFDLVLLDMLMPDLDGAETVKQLKAQQRDLCVIAMTALDRNELARRSDLFDGRVQKPLQREEFVEVVKQHLRRVLPRRTQALAQAQVPAQAQASVRPSPDKGAEKIVVTIDPDILKLIPSFLQSRVKDVTTLRESLGSGDLEVARRIGHTLKGVGASYGFPAITVFGQKIERAVLNGRLKEAREHINQLEVYLAGVVVEPAT